MRKLRHGEFKSLTHGCNRPKLEHRPSDFRALTRLVLNTPQDSPQGNMSIDNRQMTPNSQPHHFPPPDREIFKKHSSVLGKLKDAGGIYGAPSFEEFTSCF